MAVPVLIIGKSGSGKSTAMRTCVDKDFGCIRVLKKPFPFKGKIKGLVSDDYDTVKKALAQYQCKSIVIDDAGYLITNYFMKNHGKPKKGGSSFDMYNELGDDFWSLIDYVVMKLPEDKIVYFIMHEDIDDFGNIKPKTIGKLLDQKVCLEGMFTIVLRCVSNSTEHKFITQSDGFATAKSPIGMFDNTEIDNDLLMVDNTIREYYDIVNPLNNDKKESEDKTK